MSITGSDFVGATSVDFGGVSATFTVNARGTKITAYTPAEAAGTVDVVVNTPQGPSLPTPSDEFTYLGPVITGLSKTTGLFTGGTKVVIKGSGLNGATSVLFGDVAASRYTVNKGGTAVTAYSPAQSEGAVAITVTTPGGTSPLTSADIFVVS